MMIMILPYVLYGMEVSREKLDTVLEFFEGRATIIEDFDESTVIPNQPLTTF